MSGAPDFKEGLFFGLDEDTYHRVPALSNSGIKNLRASPMLFWSRSWMNPKPSKKETEFMELGKAYDCRIMDGKDAFYAKYAAALDPADYPDALRTMEDLRAALPEGVKAGKGKQETIQRLHHADPDAQIWDLMVADHALEHRGKTFLTSETIARIEIAAKMIELDPELSKAFSGGYPQVSIFWRCPETKVPMKARLDYLKLKAIVDLKTFGNPYDRPVDIAVFNAMASQRYHIQAVVYQEAIAIAKRLPVFGDVDMNWLASFQKAPPPEFLFVFQMTGEAPVTRGFTFPAGLLTSEVGKVVVREAKERFKACMEAYGTDPWLDLAPIRSFSDEDFPQRMTME